MEEISEYYKEKGYTTAHIFVNKEPRRNIVLTGKGVKKLVMSYAKYLYTSHHKIDIDKTLNVDHINCDKMDDRIDNLQLISSKYNRQKDHSRREMVMMICPVCKTEFLFPKRNLSTHTEPCCSRRCGGIKSHWTKKTKQD